MENKYLLSFCYVSELLRRHNQKFTKTTESTIGEETSVLIGRHNMAWRLIKQQHDGAVIHVYQQHDGANLMQLGSPGLRHQILQ